MTDREVVELQAQQQARPRLKLSKPVHAWSHNEIFSEIGSGSALDLARSRVKAVVSKIMNSLEEREIPPAVELRRMEFQAVVEIAKALGLEVVYETETETETKPVYRKKNG